MINNLNSNTNYYEQLNSSTHFTPNNADSSSIYQQTYTNTQQSTKSSIFQIVHWNCRSLYNKKAKILQYLETYKPNILILNEINCQEHIINFISHNTSYQIEAKCRKNKRGGGVCIFIKSNMNIESSKHQTT